MRFYQGILSEGESSVLLTSLSLRFRSPIFYVEYNLPFLQKATLMKRSMVLSLPVLFVFLFATPRKQTP